MILHQTILTEMKQLNCNFVLIRVDDVKSEDGFGVVTRYNEFEHASRKGVVLLDSGEYRRGDIVYIEPMAYTRISQGEEWMGKSDNEIFVHSDAIVARKRKHLEAMNNFVLVKPKMRNRLEFSIDDEECHDRGEVAHYSGDKFDVGDDIIMAPYRNNPLENELHQRLPHKYFFMRDTGVVFNITKREPVGEFLFVDANGLNHEMFTMPDKIEFNGVISFGEMAGLRVSFRKSKQNAMLDGKRYEVIHKQTVNFIENMEALKGSIVLKRVKKGDESFFIVGNRDSVGRIVSIHKDDADDFSLDIGDEIYYFSNVVTKIPEHVAGDKDIIVIPSNGAILKL